MKAELRQWMYTAVVTLLLLIWIIDKGREIASLESTIRANENRIEQLENRNADMLAWIITTREKIIESGVPINPPPLPEE